MTLNSANNMKHRIFLTLPCFTLLLPFSAIFSSAAVADTTCTSSGLAPAAVLPSSLEVPHRWRIGTFINNGGTVSEALTINCSGNGDHGRPPEGDSFKIGLKATGTYVATYNGRRIYATEVPGVGYALAPTMALDHSTGAPEAYGKYIGEGNTIQGDINTSGVVGTRSPYKYRYSTRVSLVKTGTVQPGKINRQKIGEMIHSINGINQPPVDVYLAPSQITTSGCSVDTQNVSIPMGDFLTSDFTGIGSRTSRKYFKWSINCDPNQYLSADFVIGSSADAGPNGTAKLTGAGQAGVASGIGVRLLTTQGLPLNLSDAKQHLFASLQNGQNDIEYTVAYEQTAPTVTAGKADSTLTLTITYR